MNNPSVEVFKISLIGLYTSSFKKDNRISLGFFLIFSDILLAITSPSINDLNNDGEYFEHEHEYLRPIKIKMLPDWQLFLNSKENI